MLRAIVFNTTTRSGHHGCAVVARQISTLAGEANIGIVRWLGLDIPRRFAERSDYDLILVNGEGSVHHDQPGALRVAEIGRLSKQVGRPAYLINSSYEANGALVADGVACFRRTYVRDGFSRSELAQAGIAAAVVPDLSLTWNHAPIGVTGDQLVVIDSVRNSVSAELFSLAATNAGRYLTMKTVPPILPDFPDRNHVRRAKFFVRRAAGACLPHGWRREKLQPSHPSFGSFISALTDQAGLIVSGRFHGVCLAIVLEIPVLGLRSNTSKVEALLADAGLQDRLAGSVGEVAQRLAGTPIEAFRYTDVELDRLRAFRQHASDAARAMLVTIAGDVVGQRSRSATEHSPTT